MTESYSGLEAILMTTTHYVLSWETNSQKQHSDVEDINRVSEIQHMNLGDNGKSPSQIRFGKSAYGG